MDNEDYILLSLNLRNADQLISGLIDCDVDCCPDQFNSNVISALIE